MPGWLGEAAALCCQALLRKPGLGCLALSSRLLSVKKKS